MDTFLRDLIMQVHRGDSANLPYLYDVARTKYSVHIFNYLLRHNLTGFILSEYIRLECDGSSLRFIAKTLNKIGLTNTAPDLIVGKNFR